jgi:hypothetical protein
METFLPQTIRAFRCEKCDFITSNKKDYNRHISSVKHIRRAMETGGGINQGKYINFTQHANKSENIVHITPISTYNGCIESSNYTCETCGQVYQSKSGIWKHKKKCDKINNSSNDAALKTMMFDMIKNNQEFQNKVIEMMCVKSVAASAAAAAVPVHSEITNSNNFNGTNYSHNKTFNLQFFLNEQCKDAMNISDFVSSITLKLSDLDGFGKVGYVEGISKIIIDNLRDTDIYKRPVHCSDAKRETLYVKDDNRWEREGPENEKMTNAVRVIEHKNISLINEWAKNNPKCEDSSTKENTQYINLSRAVLDGDDQNIAKVIKRVTKEVVIDK